MTVLKKDTNCYFNLPDQIGRIDLPQTEGEESKACQVIFYLIILSINVNCYASFCSPYRLSKILGVASLLKSHLFIEFDNPVRMLIEDVDFQSKEKVLSY